MPIVSVSNSHKSKVNIIFVNLIHISQFLPDIPLCEWKYATNHIHCYDCYQFFSSTVQSSDECKFTFACRFTHTSATSSGFAEFSRFVATAAQILVWSLENHRTQLDIHLEFKHCQRRHRRRQWLNGGGRERRGKWENKKAPETANRFTIKYAFNVRVLCGLLVAIFRSLSFRFTKIRNTLYPLFRCFFPSQNCLNQLHTFEFIFIRFEATSFIFISFRSLCHCHTISAQWLQVRCLSQPS